MTYRFALPVLAVLVAGACSARDATGPTTKETSLGASAAVSSSRNAGAGNAAQNSRRSGALHMTKECSEYTGLAGSFCTITSSNLKQMPVGSKVVYTDARGATLLDTDLIVNPPGPGNNIAFGHVVLDLLTGIGTATFSGGTGEFRKFHAIVAVSPPLVGINWRWDGTYSFDNDDDDDRN